MHQDPRVYDYLRSFRVDAVASAGVYGAELATLTSPHPDAPGHRPSALSGPPAPEQGMLYRYAIPGTSFGFALVGVSMEVDGLPKVDPVRARLLLRQAGYDYVLIDTPVDLTMPGVSYAAMLSDVAVVCIPPRRPALQQAADLADQLQRQATGGIRILAAPTLRDVSQPWYGEARDSARKAFAKLLDESTGAPNSAIEIVEVPEPTYDTYDDVLAVLADTPGEQSSLLSAYEQMASWISGGAVTRVAEVPERIRRRYRRGCCWNARRARTRSMCCTSRRSGRTPTGSPGSCGGPTSRSTRTPCGVAPHRRTSRTPPCWPCSPRGWSRPWGPV